MASFVGLDKVFKLFRIVKQNGGILGSYMKLYRYVGICECILFWLHNACMGVFEAHPCPSGR